jgi:hypothetical protein
MLEATSFHFYKFDHNKRFPVYIHIKIWILNAKYGIINKKGLEIFQDLSH